MKTKSLMLAALSTLLLGLLPNIANAATMTQASTSVDLAAQTIGFQIVFNGPPDLLTLDSGGRPADSFQYFIFNASLGPSAFQSWLQLGFVSSDFVITENAGTMFMQTGASFRGLAVPVYETIPFTLSGNVLDFAVAFSVLNETDGAFTYLLSSFRFGAETRIGFAGASGGNATQVDPFAELPLPAALPLFATGLGLMGLLGWRRKRKAGTAKPTSNDVGRDRTGAVAAVGLFQQISTSSRRSDWPP
jgi:hypothetical protein